MSAAATAWVWDHSPYGGVGKLVHLALADVANDLNDNRLWLRQERLAAKVGITPRRLRPHLAQMVADGYLEELHRPPGKAVEYLLVVPSVPIAAPGTTPDETSGLPRTKRPTPPDETSGVFPSMNTRGTSSGTRASSPLATTAGDDSLQLSTSPQEKNHSPVGAAFSDDRALSLLGSEEDGTDWGDMEDTRTEVSRVGLPELLDAAYWRRVDQLTEGTHVYYLDELRKYAAWLECCPPSKRQKDRKRQFMNWIRKELARDAWRVQRAAMSAGGTR